MAFQQMLGRLGFGMLLLGLFVKVDRLKLRKQKVIDIFSCEVWIADSPYHLIQSLYLCLKMAFLSLFFFQPFFKMADLPMQSDNLALLLTKHGSVVQKPSAICMLACVIDLPLQQTIDLMLQ